MRATLKDGDRFSGRVVSWDEDSLTLDTSLRRKVVYERSFPWADIVEIEDTRPNPEGTVALLVLIVGVVTLAIVGSSVNTGWGSS